MTAAPLTFVTTTSLAPNVPVGVVQVIEVGLTTVTPVAPVPPTVTVAPLENPAPVMVTAIAVAGNLTQFGDMPVTVTYP